jgi:glutamate-1-semialdehyde aminotransferase
VGSRGIRFTEYHDHERIGAEMLLQISDARTMELVSGTATDAVADALRDADDI